MARQDRSRRRQRTPAAYCDRPDAAPAGRVQPGRRGRGDASSAGLPGRRILRDRPIVAAVAGLVAADLQRPNSVLRPLMGRFLTALRERRLQSIGAPDSRSALPAGDVIDVLPTDNDDQQKSTADNPGAL